MIGLDYGIEIIPNLIDIELVIRKGNSFQGWGNLNVEKIKLGLIQNSAIICGEVYSLTLKPGWMLNHFARAKFLNVGHIGIEAGFCENHHGSISVFKFIALFETHSFLLGKGNLIVNH